MTIVRRCVPAIAACVAIGVSAAGPPAFPRATPASVGLAAAPLGEATALLTQFVAEKKIAGAVAAVARHGKLAYLESVGVQDLETRAPMTERSLFRIYSMTKPVTAAAVMMLLEEGRFQPRRSGVEISAGVQGRQGRLAGRLDASSFARDHGPGSAAAHLGLQPSHLRALPDRESARAHRHAAAVRHEDHPGAADGRSRHALPLQRGHHGAGTAGRNLVGQAVRRVSRRADLPAARHDRDELLGAVRISAPGSRRSTSRRAAAG